jgi:DNA-directed RNA polymerase specialized sigma24 family protein
MARYESIEILPEKYRMLLALFAIGGYDINEIASDLHLNGATVKTRLFRAREKLVCL